MILVFYVFINLLIIGLFLYSKLTPYKDRLTGNFLKAFNFFDNIFTPMLGLLKKIAKPFQVGNGIAVDMSQIILLLLFLIILGVII